MRRTPLVLCSLALVAGCGSTAATTKAASTAASTTSSVAPAAVVPSRTRTTGTLDVTTYHQDAQRTGRSAATPVPGTMAVGWSHDLDAPVYAQPLVVGGVVLVATENDSVYAFDATTGTQKWMHHLATPQQSSSLPCGDIDPTAGITGTPVYDPATQTLFLVADENGPHHYLYGLDVTTGATKLRVDADVPGSDPRVEQQRGALALTGGQVYVPYGALAGDCGDYHGEVVTATTAGNIVATLALPTKRGGGVWAPSGPTVAKDGSVYVTSANSAAQKGDAYEYSNGTLKLSPQLKITDYFATADWQTKDAEDLGQGSTGPTLLDGGLAVTVGKDLPNYVLDASHLGGIGGQLATSPVCAGYGGTANLGTTVYIPCKDGTTAATVDRSGLHVVWKTKESSIAGAPVLGGGAVFALAQSAGILYALAQSDGHTLGSVKLPAATTRFATPALSGNRAYVGTTKGIVCVTGV